MISTMVDCIDPGLVDREDRYYGIHVSASTTTNKKLCKTAINHICVGVTIHAAVDIRSDAVCTMIESNENDERISVSVTITHRQQQIQKIQ